LKFVFATTYAGGPAVRAPLSTARVHRTIGGPICRVQLCQLLDIPSRHDLDGFLKRHGVQLEYTTEDFDREAASSARLRQKRQAEFSGDPSRDRRPGSSSPIQVPLSHTETDRKVLQCK
jgi:hypothetical protein